MNTYRRSFLLFAAWTESSGLGTSSAAWTVYDMDRAAHTFLSYYYAKMAAEPRHNAGVGVAGSLEAGICQEVSERYRRRLPGLRRARKGWSELEPTHHHSPLPYDWMRLLSLWFACHGHRREAMGLLVGFDGYLRVSELLGLTAADVQLPEDVRGAAVTTTRLALGRTKTCAAGDEQVAVLRDTLAQAAIEWLAENPLANGRLFDCTPARFNELIAAGCAAHRLPGVFTAHCLRHGKATFDSILGVPRSDIKERGRWACEESLRTYIHVWTAYHVGLRAPASAAAALADAMNDTVIAMMVFPEL